MKNYTSSLGGYRLCNLQNIYQLFLGSFKIREKCYEETTAMTLKPIRDRNVLILIFWEANSYRILLNVSTPDQWVYLELVHRSFSPVQWHRTPESYKERHNLIHKFYFLYLILLASPKKAHTGKNTMQLNQWVWRGEELGRRWEVNLFFCGGLWYSMNHYFLSAHLIHMKVSKKRPVVI